MKSPIFIFSLPRSGSTLLQRILMSHSSIASSAEPWFLLPFIYSRKNEGVVSEYSNELLQSAMKEFIDCFPNGESDYNNELREFCLSLYQKHCKNEEFYFLDKTPRYYLIVEEIVELFPEAKFIFLVRSPIQVLASVINTWAAGGFRALYRFDNDFQQGPKLLAKSIIDFEEIGYVVKYEDLVNNPEIELISLFAYLGLDYEPEVLQEFAEVSFEGKFGDPTGPAKYKSISIKSEHAWREVFDSHLRKAWLSRYLRSFDEAILYRLGYPKTGLLDLLKNHRVNKLFSISDAFHMMYNRVVIRFQLKLWLTRYVKENKTKYMS